MATKRRKTSVTVTELHRRTAELMGEVVGQPQRPLVIEKQGKPAVVLVDARYFDGLLETLDLLSDPQSMNALRRSVEDERAGRIISHEQVKRNLGLHGRAPRRESRMKTRDREARRRKF